MARVLTGIQSTGLPHLGNILGAIHPAIEMSKQEGNDSFLFIADFHSLTTIKDAKVLHENTMGVAAAWLAFGLDQSRTTFYRQSDVPQVTELTWYLSCFTPFPMLANAHSFKDKSDRLSEVNAALFTYPVLMAADILLYNANVVPVGKDQKQHLEITRDLGEKFNRQYGEVFVIPEVQIDEQVMVVPGIDGQKMSKSYNNFIDVFLPEKALRKQVMKIVTDSKGVDEPKDPDSCNVFNLFKLVGAPDQISEMRSHYKKGGMGYGTAKQILFETLRDNFQNQRETFHALITDQKKIEIILLEGAEKAAEVANSVLKKVREVLGY